MNNKSKTRYIFDPVTKQKVAVSEEVYFTYYRPIWATFRRAHDHGICRAPGNLWWLCPDDCADCRFRFRDEQNSLEYLSEIGSQFPDTNPRLDPEAVVVDMLYFRELLERLDELMPEARQIAELRLQGYSDEAIAKKIGIERTTFLSRLKRAKQTLAEEFPDSDL